MPKTKTIYHISYKHYNILELYKYYPKVNNILFKLNMPYFLKRQGF